MSLISVLNNNKVAILFLILVLLTLLALMVFALDSNLNGFEIARYCVSSGGTCTGT